MNVTLCKTCGCDINEEEVFFQVSKGTSDGGDDYPTTVHACAAFCENCGPSGPEG